MSNMPIQWTDPKKVARRAHAEAANMRKYGDPRSFDELLQITLSKAASESGIAQNTLSDILLEGYINLHKSRVRPTPKPDVLPEKKDGAPANKKRTQVKKIDAKTRNLKAADMYQSFVLNNGWVPNEVAASWLLGVRPSVIEACKHQMIMAGWVFTSQDEKYWTAEKPMTASEMSERMMKAIADGRSVEAAKMAMELAAKFSGEKK